MNSVVIGSGFGGIVAALKVKEKNHKVIFIRLASLTFPHILLEYLIEKNE